MLPFSFSELSTPTITSNIGKWKIQSSAGRTLKRYSPTKDRWLLSRLLGFFNDDAGRLASCFLEEKVMWFFFLASFYSLERLCSPKKRSIREAGLKEAHFVRRSSSVFLFYDFDGEGGRGSEQQQPKNSAFGEKEWLEARRLLSKLDEEAASEN